MIDPPKRRINVEFSGDKSKRCVRLPYHTALEKIRSNIQLSDWIEKGRDIVITQIKMEDHQG